jgi:hypothetical protein
MPDWRFNSSWGTVIDFTGCQAGLETDGRCDILDCKFRTTKDQAPKDAITVMAMLCPRDKEVEHEESTVYLSTKSPMV